VSGVAYHLRATLLPYGDAPTDIWIADCKLTFAPQRGAEELASAGGFVLPGLVDCHVHLTLDFAESGLPPGSVQLVDANLRGHLISGTLLLRDIGAVSDATLHLSHQTSPSVHAAGRFLAPADGYFGLQQPTTSDELVGRVTQQVRSGARWIKVIADFPRNPGDLMNGEANYPQEVLNNAVEAAHVAGARVAVHTMSRAGIEAGLASGVDSIEHGPAIDEHLLTSMAARGIPWTPTLVIASAAAGMAEEMGGSRAAAAVRDGFENASNLVPTAARLGVTILAGTDMLPPGCVWQEVAALFRTGLDPADALAAASTTARAFLGEPGLEEGAPADLVLYGSDPRNDPELLSSPALVVLNGERVEL